MPMKMLMTRDDACQWGIDSIDKQERNAADKEKKNLENNSLQILGLPLQNIQTVITHTRLTNSTLNVNTSTTLIQIRCGPFCDGPDSCFSAVSTNLCLFPRVSLMLAKSARTWLPAPGSTFEYGHKRFRCSINGWIRHLCIISR